MATRIQGITIEIGAETTKLTSALSDVDKKLSGTQKALKDINGLLKLDPSNTELLRQKQKNLQTALTTTKDRLKELKSVNKDSMSPEQWDAVQREIIDTEQKLQSLQKEMKEFGSVSAQKLKAAGNKMKEFGSKVSAVGQTLTKKVTVPLVGIGAAGIAAAKDLDKGYDKIIKKTGATGKTFDSLKKEMDDVFADLPTDAETAGIAIGEVNTRFGLTGDTLEDVSKEFIKFAEINDTDLNTAIDEVDRVMEKFGIDTEDVGNVMGLLTKAGQDTGISMESLYAALDKNGATLQDLGIDLTGAVNLLAQFESNGINSSTALSALRTAQKNATKDGVDFNDALTNGVEAIKNATSETEAMTIATELFGTKGAAEMTAAIRDGRLSIDDLNTSLGDYGEVVQSTYESTQDPWDKMQVAVNNVKLAGAELGTELLDVLTPVIETVVEKVKQFREWFTSLDEGTQENIVKMGLLVAAIGPVITIIGGLIEHGGGLVTMLSNIVGTVGPLLPGGWVIAGIAAAAALIIANWDEIKAFVVDVLWPKIQEAWEGIKSAAETAFNWIVAAWNETLLPALQALGTYITETLTPVFQSIWDNVLVPLGNWLVETFLAAWQDIQAFWDSTLGPAVSALSDAFLNFWNNTLTPWMEWVGENLLAVWQNIAQLFGIDIGGDIQTAEGAFNTFWEVLKPIATWVKDTLIKYWETFKTTLSGVVDFLTNVFEGDWEGAWESIKKVFDTIWEAAIENFKGLFVAAKEAILKIEWAEMGEQIWEWIKKAFDAIGQWSTETFTKIVTKVKEINWVGLGQTVWGWIKEAFAVIGSWAWDTFMLAVNKIKEINWVDVGSKIWGWITSAFTSIGSWAWNTFQEAVSKIWEIDWLALGAGIWGTIKRGIVDWWGNGVWEAFKGWFQDALDKVKEIDWLGLGAGIWEGIKSGLEGIGEWLLGVFKDPINAIIEWVNWMIGGIEGGINWMIDGLNDTLTIDWNIAGWEVYFSPGIPHVGFTRLDYLAKGGVLDEGGRAIVGEYAPEYLTVRNGKAVVTPIEGAERWDSGQGGTTINVYAQPGMDVNQLAEAVSDRLSQLEMQKEMAYA